MTSWMVSATKLFFATTTQDKTIPIETKQWTRTVIARPTFELNSADIWRFSDFDCAIGAVVLALQNNHIAVVRKSNVKGYEFSGKWSFPGGIVRGENPDGMWAALKDSLVRRAKLEAGLDLTRLSIPGGRWGGEYPVTRYTVRGEEKFTAVVPVVAELQSQQSLKTRDKSVSEAAWIEVGELHKLNFAPANAVIAHKMVERTFGSAVSYPTPNAAIATCRENALAIFGKT